MFSLLNCFWEETDNKMIRFMYNAFWLPSKLWDENVDLRAALWVIEKHLEYLSIYDLLNGLFNIKNTYKIKKINNQSAK